MGWLSGKKTFQSKYNPTNISKRQQQTFLQDYMGMNKRQMKKFSKQTDQEVLSSGRSLTETEFKKALSSFDKHAAAKYKEYVSDQKSAYQDFLDQRKKANIKKTRMLEMKRELAEEKIKELTGQKIEKKDPEDSYRDYFNRIKKLKSSGFNRKEIAKLEAEMRLMKQPLHSEIHAEIGKDYTVNSALNQKSSPAGKEKNLTLRQEGGSKSKVSSSAKETSSIEDIKEQSKNLPDLQI